MKTLAPEPFRGGSFLGLPGDVLALIYKSLTTLQDRQNFAQCAKAVRVPQVLQLINKTTISLRPSFETQLVSTSSKLKGAPDLLHHPRGAALIELRVAGWGVGGWGLIAQRLLLELASQETESQLSQLQELERDRQKALLAGVKVLRLDNTLIKPLKALFFLCPNLATIVSPEQSLHFFVALAGAHLPCLRSVRLDMVTHANLHLFFPDVHKLCDDELQRALTDVDRKYVGVQWEIKCVRVAGNTPVSSLFACEGMQLAKCVKIVDIGCSALEPFEREKLVCVFPNAEVKLASGGLDEYASN